VKVVPVARLLGTVTVRLVVAGVGGTVKADCPRVVVGPVCEAVAASVIVPEKPARLVAAIVEVPEDPAAMLRYVGLEDTVKDRCPVARAMKVDQQLFPVALQSPVAVLWYSPAIQMIDGVVGSTPAPK